MCKNKIQFQPGIRLQSFLSQFGSEDQCRNALVHRVPPRFVRKCTLRGKANFSVARLIDHTQHVSERYSLYT